MKSKNIKEQLNIVKSAYNEIINTVGILPAESGGILLGKRSDFIVQKFIFDKNGSTWQTGYDPDIQFLNAEIKKAWENDGLEFLGFIHSHPRGFKRLSNGSNGYGDISYANKILEAIPSMEKILLPILFPTADGQQLEIFPFVAYKNNVENYFEVSLNIQDEYSNQTENFEYAKNEKVKGAVDHILMANTHIICVGVGGANEIVENLVRTGIKHITLIDFDSVDVTNLITQGFYSQDVGLFKVEALSRRLKNINPAIEVNTICKKVEDLEDKELEKLFVNDKFEKTLIMAMTDNFHTQAYLNKLSIKFKVPTIYAMMYVFARGCEVAFYIPDVTPACFRCCVSSRYKEYAKGFVNNIKSNGSTIFSTTFLNANIGLLILGMIHNNTTGFEFSNWFGQEWTRNLLQFRLSPHLENSIFAELSSNNKRSLWLDSIWQNIEREIAPKYENCPDCLSST